MKPAPFEYFAPTSAEAALDLLAEHGAGAKLLAGGQSLVPTMNFRLAQPAVLVDLNRVDELAFLRLAGTGDESRELRGAPPASRSPGVETPAVRDARGPKGGGAGARGKGQEGSKRAKRAGTVLSIGAMTRQAALERSSEVARHAPLLAAALPHIAHPQIRNRGTLGGSLAHADPAAELPAVAVALAAEIVVRNRLGERRFAARDFFQGLFSTTLEPDDLLMAVDFPALPEGTGWSFQEVARRHGDYALVGVAATLALSAGTCSAASIVLFAVGGGPVVAAGAQALLEGSEPTDARIADAARCAAHDDIDPVGDIHASTPYKRHLAEVLVRRALREARDRTDATERSGGMSKTR